MTTLNLKTMSKEELDALIGKLEKIVEIIDDANVQLSLPLESPDGDVAEDVRSSGNDVPEVQLTNEARDRIIAKFQAAYGPGTLETPELSRDLLVQVVNHAMLHMQVEKLAESIERDGKRLLARYLGIPYVE